MSGERKKKVTILYPSKMIRTSMFEDD